MKITRFIAVLPILILCVSLFSGCSRERERVLVPNTIDNIRVWTSAGDTLEENCYLCYYFSDSEIEENTSFLEANLDYIKKLSKYDFEKKSKLGLLCFSGLL